MAKRLIDVRHPFFLPRWRRIALCVVLAVWMGLELWGGNTLWALLAAALAVYCAREFFVVFDPADYRAPEDDAAPGDD